MEESCRKYNKIVKKIKCDYCGYINMKLPREITFSKYFIVNFVEYYLGIN